MTGAGMAIEPDGSASLVIKLDEGRTASPLRIDQSFKLDNRYSACSCVNWGGYFGTISDAIDKNGGPADLLEKHVDPSDSSTFLWNPVIKLFSVRCSPTNSTKRLRR